MTAWNANLWTSFDQRPRPRHDAHRHGALQPMDTQAKPLWFQLIFIASAIYGVAIWL